MMRKLIFLAALSAVPVLSQGWTDHPNTTLLSANTPCVPDHFNNGLVTAYGTWPDYPYYTGGGQNGCNAYGSHYNGAAFDTKRNRLISWGNGHLGWENNSFLSFDMATLSHSVATCGTNGGTPISCYTTSNGCGIGGSSPCAPGGWTPGTATTGTFTRLNDPSFPGGCTLFIEPDGTAAALQSYQSILYLPKHDGYFISADANACAVGDNPYAWLVDATKLGVAGAGNPWVQLSSGFGNTNASGRYCSLYKPKGSDTYPDHEVVVCMIQSGFLGFLDVDACLGGPGTCVSFKSITTIPTNAGSQTVVFDPDRRLMFVAGTSAYPYPGQGAFLYSIMVDSPYTVTQIIAQTDGVAITGASGMLDVVSFGGAGAVYDPSLKRIVFHVPRRVDATASYSPSVGSVNCITIFGAAFFNGTSSIQVGDAVFGTHVNSGAGSGLPTTVTAVGSCGGHTSNDITISNALDNGTGAAPPYPGTDLYLTFSQNTTHNTQVIFDPGTMTGVTLPDIGSNTTPVPASLNNLQGIWDQWNYVPSLGEYVLFNNAAVDVYTYKLNATATNGLTSSTTLTCVDRDGDGYGTGPGCTGPDSDDQDAGVHTGAALISKWGSLQLGLNHLGYNPKNIWYLSPTGTDAGSPPNCKNNVSAPCATWAFLGGSVSCGDALMMRGGVYPPTQDIIPPSCSAGNPFFILSYPGELPILTPGATGIASVDYNYFQSWGVTDGISNNGSGGSNACIPFAENTNIVVRHVDMYHCGVWGINGQGDPSYIGSGYKPLNDITIQDSTLHDSYGQHGYYFSCHEDATCTNIFLSRIISYNNFWNGFHQTGSFSNVVYDQLVTYSNQLSGYSWENGTSNSYISNSQSINDHQGMDLTMYDGSGVSCSSPPLPSGTVCPWAQNNNIFSGMSFYLSGVDSAGMTNNNTYAVIVGRQGSCTTSGCVNQTMNGNRFRNIVALTTNMASTSFPYLPFKFPDNAGVVFLPNTTFQGIIDYEPTDPTQASSYGGTTLGPGTGYPWTGSPSIASIISGAGGTGSVASSSIGDPKYVATCAWNNITACNLHLQSSSPALSAGVSLSFPQFDNVGTPIPNNPTLGALQPTTAFCAVSLSPTSPGPYTVGQTISTITATASNCGTTGSLVWTSSAAPTGLTNGCSGATATTTCTITGTVTTNGTYNTLISVTDGGSNSASNNPVILVNPVPSVTTCGGLLAPNCPSGTISTPYLTSGSAPVVLVTINGTGAATCAVTSGALPTSLTLSGCTITGTPSAAGTFNFHITPTDANSVSGTAVAYSIVIAGPSGLPQPSIFGKGTVSTGIKH